LRFIRLLFCYNFVQSKQTEGERMNLRDTISWLKTKIQVDLFSHVEECVSDPLTEKQKRLITTLEVIKVEDHVKSPEYQWMGGNSRIGMQ